MHLNENKWLHKSNSFGEEYDTRAALATSVNDEEKAQE